MARFDLNRAWSYIFQDRRDSVSGYWRCRFCGKPVIPNGKRSRTFYCNDACYSACIEMLSWEHARHLTYDRDKGICQMCGTKVYLHGEGDVEAGLRWYRDEYKDSYRHYYVGERKAEIHHVIPMTDLMALAIEESQKIEDEKKREYWMWKLGVMLQLDVNNLTTLCVHPCHDDVHNRESNLKRKQIQNDKIWEKCALTSF